MPTARSSCSSTGYPDPERPDDLAALELSPRNPGDADLELASAPLRRRTDRRRFSTWDVPEAMQTALMQRAAEQGALLRVITGRARRTLGNDTARCRHSARQHAPYQTETALWTGVEWIDDGIPSANLLAVPPDPAHGRRFTPGRIEQERSDEPDGALLVVVHAHEFPGGRENVAGMLHHFRFVRDHHRAVRRVALAADGTVADLAARLAEHFIHAEIKRFDYDELDDAIAWAGQAAGQDSRPLPKGPAAPVRVGADKKTRA